MRNSLPENFDQKLRVADANLDNAKKIGDPIWFLHFVDDLKRMQEGERPDIQYPGWGADDYRQLIDVILQKKEAREILEEAERLAA